MRFLFRLLAAGLLAAGLAAPAAAGDKPTMDDARALTLKAADLVATAGLEEAAATFNADGPFKYGEIYVNVIDMDGVWKVYPPRPAGVGQSVLNVKDADGKLLVQDIIAVARGPGEGWVEYRWLNPASNRIEPKVTYVKRVPGRDLIAYVGIYK
ncbi:cache domain-containing protein [Azospirillum halopraeferens]|uniref:cache domain-containing protein n=1 Tax=Azospirillum halopraeferens TaxID=34010 RepID=UPI00040DEA9B|nr:cache domain-containing protein [Azospirillum halopraeferens]